MYVSKRGFIPNILKKKGVWYSVTQAKRRDKTENKLCSTLYFFAFGYFAPATLGKSKCYLISLDLHHITGRHLEK